MKIRASWLCVQTSVWVLASAFCLMGLTGCGANGNLTQQSPGSDTAVAGLHGIVHGGPNPVIGATVTLYATTTENSPSSGNNYGYGEAGTPLGTAQTGAGGAFSFSGTETACPNGQQAYIVSVGGHTGTNAANTAAVLMAAIGPCSGLTEGASGTTVIIDEPTTIAAAYALSGFMTVSGTTVNISAPANNNAATAACTVVSNATTTCKASGLAHAFLNAKNLVNSTTGVANTTISTGSTITATVPQLLINTLANSVEACINSAGSTSSACSTVLGYSAYATLNPNITTPPTNTLQALQYLALYPVEAASPTSNPPAPAASTTAFFNVANSNAYYNPALTSAPLDYTIAINYVFSPTGSALAPWGAATDINDNVYVSLAGTPTIYSITSNGAQNWETATGTSAGCSTTGTRCSVRPDTLGNVWYIDNSGLTKLSQTGVLGATFTSVDTLNSLTVDLGNNVWLSANAAGTATTAQPAPSDLEELPQGQTTSPLVDVSVGGVALTGSTPLRGLTFDSAGNLWGASDNASGGGTGVLLMISNNNLLTAPNFDYTGATNPAVIFTATPNHSNTPMIDAGGNMWLSTDAWVYEVASSGSETGGATNYGTSATAVYGTADGEVGRFAIMDGDGKIVWDAAAGNQGFVSLYYPNADYDNYANAGSVGANVYLNPCSVVSGTTCTLNGDGGSFIMNAIRMSAVDDSGAIWSATSSGSNLTQILGPAAPSWGYAPYIPEAILTNTSERPY